MKNGRLMPWQRVLWEAAAAVGEDVHQLRSFAHLYGRSDFTPSKFFGKIDTLNKNIEANNQSTGESEETVDPLNQDDQRSLDALRSKYSAAALRASGSKRAAAAAAAGARRPKQQRLGLAGTGGARRGGGAKKKEKKKKGTK